MTTSLPLLQTKTFCVLPWLHLTLLPDGSAKLCCVARASGQDGSEALSLNEQSLDEIWNSSYLRGVRRDMLAGKFVTDCSACYVSEKRGEKSRRLVSNAQWAQELGPALDELIAESQRQDYGLSSLPLYYQLMPGNLCNLKCRMCFPVYSSQIERDPVHSKWTPVLLEVQRLRTEVDWTSGQVALCPHPPHGVRYEGFHQVEEPVGASPFRWTNGRATLSIAPPPDVRAEAIRLRLGRRHHWSQRVRVLINDVCVFEGGVPRAGLDRTIAMPEVRTSSKLSIRLESDTFRVAGDSRELGVAVEAVDLRHTARPAVSEHHKSGPAVMPSPSERLPVGPWHRDDDWVREVLLRNVDELRSLYFTGGEPMLERQVERILDHLIERGVADRIAIEMNTNCTTLRDERLAKLQKFRSVTLGLSIDSQGPYYEYIRYPARWETVRRNVDRLMSMDWPRLHVAGGVVLQVYNALNLTSVLEFFDAREITYRIEVAVTPPFLAVGILPARVRALAAERLEEYAVSRCRPQMREHVTVIAKHLRSLPERTSPEILRTLMLFSNDLDATRQQSTREVHGELLALLQEDGFHWTDETTLSGAA